MKSDLDRLMAERGVAALLVLGHAAHNAPMTYLANGAHVGERTVLVKKRGARPVLFANPMERDEAAASGLRVVMLNRFPLAELIEQEQGNRLRAVARQLGQLLAEAGVTSGKVVVAGQVDLGAGYALLTAASELNPGLDFTGEYEDSVLSLARATKDAEEVRRIRAVGRKTLRVVAGTEEFLTRHRARDGYLVQKDGSRLTIGAVRRHIRQLLHTEGLAETGGDTIFAIGRDAGVPHSRGNDRHPLRLGQTIVYDIFPAEAGGGYFYDFTRTWCLGYAPPEVEQAYADVLATFNTVRRALQPGELTRRYQALTCQLLEARGHPTIGSDPRTTSGYVHSLAHGVGLDIHESPRFADSPDNLNRLEPGVVITLEPGLYYPERGYGIRIEDTLWLNPATLRFQTLGTYPKDLVLKVKGVPGRRR